MIALGLLIALQASAVDAERAFASMAQTRGQWTAFRAYAAEEGIMFTPQAIDALTFLKDLKDPPQSVMWWPAEAYVSCDGRTAVTTGPWLRAGGTSAGYFTTVWQQQSDGGWKWLLDHGDAAGKPGTAGDRVLPRRAACNRLNRIPMVTAVASAGRAQGGGQSADGTLRWDWRVEPDGGREVTVTLWNGSAHREVLRNRVAGNAQ